MAKKNHSDMDTLTTQLIHQLDYRIQHRKSELLAPYGLTPYQAMSLIYICDHEADGVINQRRIERYTRLSNPGVTKLIDALCSHGYAERLPDPSDARSHSLRSTEAGRALCETLRRIMMSFDSEVLAGLTKEETAELNALIGKLNI